MIVGSYFTILRFEPKEAKPCSLAFYFLTLVTPPVSQAAKSDAKS